MKPISPIHLACAVVLGSLPQLSAAGGDTISETLSRRLPTLADTSVVAVIITLSHQDMPIDVRRKSGTNAGMIRSLRDSVDKRFDRIRRRVVGLERAGPATTFWINQTVALNATRDVIERLAGDPEVALIEADDALFFGEPVVRGPAVSPTSGVPPWSLTITGVDSVWATYGLDGTGILIGSLDTGIDPGHPALVNKLRIGDAWKDFIFGRVAPYDNLGHGTFGSGILVGAGGPAGAMPAIGIAYRSRLVVGKILDAGASTIAQVTTGMQWILDPDGDPGSDDFPRVVNNSWFSGTRGSTYAYSAAAAWRAAGIIPVFCAGNSGPSAGTTRSPADYKICISVGGTNASDARYANTSVGPAPADTLYFPADGRKPDLAAPGEAVLSSHTGGGFGTSSGTSWSSPHVAGVIALMLQANPSLDYDAVMSILRHSAIDLGASGYDHVFGYGRISAMGAVTEALRRRVVVTVGAGWNLVSVPTIPVNAQRSEVFPTSVSAAFGYDSAYSAEDTLRPGEGYWLKFGGAQTVPVPGESTAVATVAVRSGWNLIGSVSRPIASSEIPSEPPEIITSRFFGYRHGYHHADTVHPGLGYWVKVAVDGFLLLGSKAAGITSSSRRSP